MKTHPRFRCHTSCYSRRDRDKNRTDPRLQVPLCVIVLVNAIRPRTHFSYPRGSESTVPNRTGQNEAIRPVGLPSLEDMTTEKKVGATQDLPLRPDTGPGQPVSTIVLARSSSTVCGRSGGILFRDGNLESPPVVPLHGDPSLRPEGEDLNLPVLPDAPSSPPTLGCNSTTVVTRICTGTPGVGKLLVGPLSTA